MPDNQINLISNCQQTLLFVDSPSVEFKIKKITCRPCEATFKISANAVLPTVDIDALLKTLPGYNAGSLQMLLNDNGTLRWNDV